MKSFEKQCCFPQKKTVIARHFSWKSAEPRNYPKNGAGNSVLFHRKARSIFHADFSAHAEIIPSSRLKPAFSRIGCMHVQNEQILFSFQRFSTFSFLFRFKKIGCYQTAYARYGHRLYQRKERSRLVVFCRRKNLPRHSRFPGFRHGIREDTETRQPFA